MGYEVANLSSSTCVNVMLDESSMVIVFTIVDDTNQEVKYACTCENFAQARGIDHSKLSVSDWKNFCASMKGKKVNFILKDNSDE